MEASETPRQGGRSGGAGIVAGLLLIGLLLLGLAMAISFAISAQHQAELDEAKREEQAKRIEAEQHEAAAKARAEAEHERALAAEKARAEHEARQIEALHAEELARAREGGPPAAEGATASPPGLKPGVGVLLFQEGKGTTCTVTALAGAWVQVKLRGGTLIWVNFLRVDRYEILP